MSQVIPLDTNVFRFLSTGNPDDALKAVNDLYDHHVLSGPKLKALPNERDEEREDRIVADRGQIIATALANGAASMKLALGKHLLEIYRKAQHVKTTEALESPATKEDDLLEQYLETIGADNVFSGPALSRLRTFLFITLPKIESHGVLVTADHMTAVLNEEQQISIPRAIRAIGQCLRKTDIDAEKAQEISDVILGKKPMEDTDIFKKYGDQSTKERITIKGFTVIKESGWDVVFQDIGDEELAVIRNRLRGYAEVDGW